MIVRTLALLSLILVAAAVVGGRGRTRQPNTRRVRRT